MEYRHLGRTGLRVSPLCLGTMNFGPRTSEADSRTVMDAAHEHGINFFDTANGYGSHKGETEEIVGRWFAQGGGRREKTVLATKLYGDMTDWPNDGKLSAYNIRQACDASLKRLQTDHIDLYQMHHVDRATPWEEIWEGFSVLRQQGKVLYVGSSNFAGWHLALAQASAAERKMVGLVSEQSLYNLMSRWVELEVLPAAEHHGLGVIPWSPLAGGLLGGVLAKQAGGDEGRGTSNSEGVEKNRATLQAYEEFCADLGAHPADVGVAWLLTRPAVTAPIIGPRTVEQLTNSLRAIDLELDQAALDRLDELFPAPFPNPGKPAPEAYAW
ncbi:aldo/keto reductase [Kineococcus rhizosphaerae]|uniref:Aryl-alcohol dehydrogenase-like predicted oxidoreductase n=1 Tax=Kineococcus rhizosphaerae TaxID=559628 RepID=A0A2T0QXM0_9ACTN|nr:aldo/keto reductase [Kineococcus rhizosphaerae]PRY10782.1 aryl-alcohol dehydrogenase-like predicted oxidoreductase [Kineococcus rhizosphaerae]